MVLAAQEAVGADAGCRASLGGELGERRDFERGDLTVRRARVPCAGDDDAVARDGSEEDRSCAGTELDAGDTAAGAALRAHVRSVEVQQLRLVRDERQLLGAGLQFDGADDDVVALERDDLHDRLVRVLRRHALDDARRGAECEAGGVGAQRRHRQHLLAGCEVDERGNGRAAVEDGRLVRVDEVRQFERADTEQPTC